MNLSDRVFRRFAKLSDEQKEEIVEEAAKVLKDKKAESDDSSPKDTSKDTAEDEKTMERMIEQLSKDIDEIREDGKVERNEFLDLTKKMMDMVMALSEARPPVNRKDKKAARGYQVRRKDKDLMDDTGGISKRRDREPSQKPPRDDVKNRYRTKDKPADERDEDVDKNKDKKAREHPLDRVVSVEWGTIPEGNYYRKVWSCLVDIMADERKLSEKSFKEREKIHKTADEILRTPDAMEVVGRFEGDGLRPSFCAECINSMLIQVNE